MSMINESVKEAAEKIEDAEMVAVAARCSCPASTVEEIAAIIQETCFTLRSIETAPRDGTEILLKMKDRKQRYVATYKEGWHVAAPIGVGYGIPDEWIEGWMPLPVTQETK